MLTRMRTIFQSLDTARYQKDVSADRRFDTAHARSEAMSALIFGHEVVIPAGIVADCPAFVDLFEEIMAPADTYRTMMSRQGDHYRLFRLGLEPRFRDVGGLSGYDAFIEDYRKSFEREGSEALDLVAIADVEVGRRQMRLQQQRVDFLVDAFMNKKWREISSSDQRYGDHMRRVYSEFSPRAQHSASPVWARDNFFHDLDEGYYEARIGRLCDELERRMSPYATIERIRSVTKQVGRRLVNPRSRGQWYKCSDAYGEDWRLVRNWFDEALYRLMITQYRVAFPSLFLQEIDDEQTLLESAMAFIGADTVRGFSTANAAGREALPPPILSSVEWRDIWALVSEPDFQDSVERLQTEFADIYDSDRAWSSQVSREFGGKTHGYRKAIGRVLTSRRRRIEAAIDRHVDFINGGQTKIAFERTSKGRLSVTTRSDGGLCDLGRGVAKHVLGTGRTMLFGVATTALGVPDLGFVNWFLAKYAERLAGKYADRRTERPVDWIVDKIGRDPTTDGAWSDLVSAERRRVNLWITPV